MVHGNTGLQVLVQIHIHTHTKKRKTVFQQKSSSPPSMEKNIYIGLNRYSMATTAQGLDIQILGSPFTVSQGLLKYIDMFN